jgi:small subunit ribosomal protein S4
VPSLQLKQGDTVEVRVISKERAIFQALLEEAEGRTIPTWLNRDVAALTGKMVDVPNRQEIFEPVNEQLIVEFYSR